jgi:hypothetical protein
MIKLLRADKHRQLGRPGGGRCGICESTDDVRNLWVPKTRFHALASWEADPWADR